MVMLLCNSSALAQDPIEAPEPSDWQVLLQLDNDLFAGSDRDYTSGVRIGFVQEIPLESDEGQRMDKRLSSATKKFSVDNALTVTAHKFFAKAYSYSLLEFENKNSLLHTQTRHSAFK